MASGIADAFLTTSGVPAMANLQAQIEDQEHEAVAGRLTVSGRAGLIDLIALRGHVLGCMADYDRAEALAERLAQDAPSDVDAVLARARSRATFHRFSHALTDLDSAQRLGANPRTVNAERAAIFQAIGQYEQALTIYNEAVKRRADFNSLGDLATLHAERGQIAAAENCFTEARKRCRGVSPIPLAQLDLKRAQMWIAHHNLQRAHLWLDAAVCRLPEYAPAQGHLAEVEAALGETDSAIARVRSLAHSSDDPDYALQLARILGDTGCFEEAREWRDHAAARYDELVEKKLEAFADHAAEFWLEAGADPRQALWLAHKNLEVRPTRRACELVARATHSAMVHAREWDVPIKRATDNAHRVWLDQRATEACGHGA
jgi:tetratricopeptide (TPR) repeat protein